MAVTASGLKVTGEVQATTGKIGGFNIKASAIWNNLSSFGGSQSRGVYIGTDGIQLGQRFKVDTSGNVTATRLTVDTLYIGGTAVSASTLNSRANSAYTSTSSGGYCYGGANAGYKFDAMINNRYEATYLKGKYIYATQNLNTPILIVEDYRATWKTATIGGTTIRYLGR